MNTINFVFTSVNGFSYEVFASWPSDNGFQSGMEVTGPAGSHVDEIGLWFDENNTLVDYDGVAILTKNHIRAIEHAGYTVPEEYKKDIDPVWNGL